MRNSCLTLFVLFLLPVMAKTQEVSYDDTSANAPTQNSSTMTQQVIHPQDFYPEYVYPNTNRLLKGAILERVEGTRHQLYWNSPSPAQMFADERYNHHLRVLRNQARHENPGYAKLSKLGPTASNTIFSLDYVFGNMRFDNDGNKCMGFTPPGQMLTVDDSKTIWTEVWERHTGSITETFILKYRRVTNYDLCGNEYDAYAFRIVYEKERNHVVITPPTYIKVPSPPVTPTVNLTIVDYQIADSQGPTARWAGPVTAPEGYRTSETLLSFSVAKVTLPKTIVNSNNVITNSATATATPHITNNNVNNNSQSQAQSQAQAQAQAQAQSMPKGNIPPPDNGKPQLPPSVLPVVPTPPDKPPVDTNPPLPSSH